MTTPAATVKRTRQQSHEARMARKFVMGKKRMATPKGTARAKRRAPSQD